MGHFIVPIFSVFFITLSNASVDLPRLKGADISDILANNNNFVCSLFYLNFIFFFTFCFSLIFNSFFNFYFYGFVFLFNFYLSIYVRPCYAACEILVTLPGIKLVTPAMEAQSLNCWTSRDIPLAVFQLPWWV